MTSPWGPIQQQTTIAPGITQVSTAGHGGILLSFERQKAMPAALKLPTPHYEEDCDWALVALAFPDEFKRHYAALPRYDGDIIESAKKIVRDYYPENYEAHFGVTLQPGESMKRDEEVFNQTHKDDLISVSAYGDWHERVPEGMVGIRAARGGRRDTEQLATFFLVPAEEYKKRGRWGLVVDETRHFRIEEL